MPGLVLSTIVTPPARANFIVARADGASRASRAGGWKSRAGNIGRRRS